MPEPPLEISGASIVLIGAFNPPIFQPEWFAKQSLLSETEAQAASIQIIHSQVCQFETERFFFQITPDRFMAATKPNAVAEPLRDLVLGTFYLLEHTPVQAMGLNRQMHFAMQSQDDWHKLGDRLAPKEAWQLVMDGRPGLKNLQILYGSTSPTEPSTTVIVQPSALVVHGVYFEINAHYSLGKDDLKFLITALNDRWEGVQTDAERVARKILTWAATEG